jgi:hypothetical protein
MKKFLTYLIIFFSVIVLYQLNTCSFNDTGPQKNIVTISRYTDTIPPDYLQILHLKQGCCKYTPKSNFYLENTTITNLRSPISAFVYKRNYYLQIYSLDSSFSASVNNIITESYVNSTNLGHSLGDMNSAVEYFFPNVLPKKFSRVKLKLIGENNKIILKNDSMAYYYSLFQKFAVQYDKENTNEIYGEAKGSFLFYTNRLPLEILFLKRNHNLYLITMSVYLDSKYISYNPGMLYTIIYNKNADNN